MDPGASADVKMPVLPATSGDLGLPMRKATLLYRAGKREGCTFIWLGDEACGDNTLYVAFSPLRRRRQIIKVFRGADLVEDTVQSWLEKSVGTVDHFTGGLSECLLTASDHITGAGRAARPIVREHLVNVRMSSYVKRKLDKLWNIHGFWDMVLQAITKYPTHTIIFTGISHGGTLAQAGALKFNLMISALGLTRNVYVVSWNAYKWTDAAGCKLMDCRFKNRLLPLVLSQRENEGPRRWDSVAGYPPHLKPIPGTILLDIDTGCFFQVADIGESHLGGDFLDRMLQLHFASQGLRAMRKATETALAADPAGVDMIRETSRSVICDGDSEMDVLETHDPPSDDVDSELDVENVDSLVKSR